MTHGGHGLASSAVATDRASDRHSSFEIDRLWEGGLTNFGEA
jgi:hypothetical protein